MRILNYIQLLSVAILLWQCEPVVDDFKASAGEADFINFVSIGDSYAAGYTDGALSYDGQQCSFPNIIANQLKNVGLTTEFKQPLVPVGKSVGSSGNGSYVLQVVSGSISPVATTGNAELFLPANGINAESPYNNVAVPGAKSFHLLTKNLGDYTLGTGNYNPFYSRFASNPGTSTAFGDGMANHPTFVSLWIGGNDVLAYALAGGEGTVGGIGSTDITDVTTFTQSIHYMFSTLKDANIKCVTGNLGNINTLPYFTTVPYNGLVLTAEQAIGMNSAYATYNAYAQANNLPKLNFVEGANGFVVKDKLGYMRHAAETDMILLSALSNIKANGWGSKTAIESNYVLDATEVANIQNYTTSFNTILKSKADECGFAFVDMNHLMNTIVAKKVIDGVEYSSTFVTGGVFSLDGIHATPRGCAIIANEFIKAINTQYHASVPLVNINDYRVNIFP
jgi:hypothetical protein